MRDNGRVIDGSLSDFTTVGFHHKRSLSAASPVISRMA